MPNIYDIYLQFKAIGAIEYKNELLVFSKEVEVVLSQESTDEEYPIRHILPFYQIASIIKKDIAAKRKSLLRKIINGKILFDNINFVVRLQDYIHFLLKQREANIDYLLGRGQLSAIADNIKKYDSSQNLRLKEIYLSAIKRKMLHLYDSLYFDKEEIITQIEKSECEIGEKHFLAINKLINLTSKTGTKKLEKIVADLIAQNPILSYYQSINTIKDFNFSKQLFLILQTNYPYEDIVFDIKTSFERATKSKLYIKYDATQQQIIFEIITDNKEEKYKLYDRLIVTLQKYLDKSKSVFTRYLTDTYSDIWAFELHGSNVKQSLNNDLHNLMFRFRHCWTQDYAVSVTLIIISKILHTLYKSEDECSEVITALYENWLIFLFKDYTTTNMYQFHKNKEFRTASLLKQVESMSNDIDLLSGFSENEQINKQIRKIQKTVTELIEKLPENHIEKESVVFGLLEEIGSSLGVYRKNLPYIALLIKTYKESLWKII
jgi:hypothetical protein